MTDRPFCSQSIDQLEAIVAAHRQDQQTLHVVRSELTFRSTARAQHLVSWVDQLLATSHSGREGEPFVPRGEASQSSSLHSQARRVSTAATLATSYTGGENVGDAQKPSETSLWSIDQRSLARFTEALKAPLDEGGWFTLRRAAEELALSPGFDRLITLNANSIRELPHQIDVARRVLRNMGGRAILADEVGLGKTIEAGIILKELAVRGLARRILILTPAALVDQWRGELESKFFELFEAPKEPDEWRRVHRGITSYHRAIQPKHAASILRHRWDLVIVDEAHKVKNHKGKFFQFLQQLERNYVLLLTATPLQNDLRELFNLVTLLRPGQLGTWREFRQRHMVQGDVRRPRDPEALKELTAQVMIRTRRSSVAHALELPPRRPQHPSIVLSASEAALYTETVTFLRQLHAEGFIVPTEDEAREDESRRRRRTGKGILQLELMRLCQRLCSSSRALAGSLETLANGEYVSPVFRGRARDLAASARAITTHAKLNALTTLLGQHEGQIIVFSEHLPTLSLIAEHVQKLGRPVVTYQGGLSREARAARLAAFKRSTNAVFVATRAGTEGLNLQFANVLVNYELPWNPMVVEQRIGRIHRIGQTRDSFIINFAAVGTIEAHILKLLDQKIQLFQLVVGELDVILGEFGGADELEGQLATAWLSARSEHEFEAKVEAIGDAIVQSREAGIAQERLTSNIAAEDNAMRLEKEFTLLTIPARVRLGYGTNHLRTVRGVEAKREHLGLHVGELLEALDGSAVIEDAGVSADYGALVTLTGLTRRGRAVHLTVQADRLPMLLVDIDADEEAPLVATASGPVWSSAS